MVHSSTNVLTEWAPSPRNRSPGFLELFKEKVSSVAPSTHYKVLMFVGEQHKDFAAHMQWEVFVSHRRTLALFCL